MGTCDDSDVHFSERRDGNMLIRRWAAQDCSGNFASHQQVITIKDSTAPVFSRYPASDTVECDCDTFPQVAKVVAIDNCDGRTEIGFTEDKVAGVCEDTYTITRRWSASDTSGNDEEHVQVIMVQDTTAPQFHQANLDLKATCEAIPPATTISAVDNCDETVVTNFVQTQSPSDCEYSIFRTYTASDRCGNDATPFQQIISVADNDGPTVGNKKSSCLIRNGKWAHFTDDELLQQMNVFDNCGSSTIQMDAPTGTGISYGSGVLSLQGASADNTDGARGGVDSYTISGNVVDNCGNATPFTKEFQLKSLFVNRACYVGEFDDAF